MTVIWSEVLQKDCDGTALKQAYIDTNNAFYEAVKTKDLAQATALDQKCTKVFDEMADWMSREGADVEPFIDFKDQADRTAEERERTLQELIHSEHQAHKANRDLAVTANGYIAAHESEHHPHVIDPSAVPPVGSALLEKGA
mmetsp:Transcript_1718/g.4829  ORF Transcript_1718/g.4829 Transcript_1718/m.4829 type:complete len:142 (+) Transcript_1718:111-536(+)